MKTVKAANVGILPRLTSEQHDNPDRTAQPRYWVDELEVANRLARQNWEKGWLFGWRDTGRSTDERTIICSVLPRTAVSNKLPLALLAEHAAMLSANWSSFIFDYTARQKVSGATINFFLVKQFVTLSPKTWELVPPWVINTVLSSWICARVLELSYTSWDMRHFAQDLGDAGPPFRWDEERRFAMRAELDAAFFQMYGIEQTTSITSWKRFRSSSAGTNSGTAYIVPRS